MISQTYNREVLDRLEEKKQAALKKNNIIRLCAAALIIVLTLTAYSMGSGGEGIVFAAFALFLSVPIVSGIARHFTDKGRKALAAEFKQEIVRGELERVFDAVSYEPDKRFSNDMVYGLHVFMHTDKISGEDLFHARWNGTAFAHCDLRTYHRVETRDSDGKKDHHYTVCFNGTVFQFERSLPYPARVLLRTEGFQDIRGTTEFKLFDLLRGRGATDKIVTDSAAFNQQYDLVSDDPAAALSLFTPGRMEALMQLDQALNTKFALLFQGNHMYAFLSGWGRFEIKVKKKLDFEEAAITVARQADELQHIVDLLLKLEL